MKKEKRKSHNSLCAPMGVVVVVVDTLEGGRVLGEQGSSSLSYLLTFSTQWV